MLLRSRPSHWVYGEIALGAGISGGRLAEEWHDGDGGRGAKDVGWGFDEVIAVGPGCFVMAFRSAGASFLRCTAPRMLPASQWPAAAGM